MQNKPLVINQPKDWFILAFHRSTEFPRPGSIVAVKQDKIRKHVEAVNSTREEYDQQYSKIRSVFLNQLNVYSEELFYDSSAEKTWGIDCEVPLRVIGLVPAKGPEPMYARCELPLFIWPADISAEDRILEIEVNWIDVIQPVICSKEHMISDVPPDNVDTFGFQDRKLGKGYYRIYTKNTEDAFDDNQLAGLIIQLGLKEYSRITKMPEPAQPMEIKKTYPTIGNPEEVQDLTPGLYPPISTQDAEAIQDDQELYIKVCMKHPLYEYTLLLYETSKQAILDQGLPMVEGLDDDLYYQLFDAMLRTTILKNPHIGLSNDDQNDEPMSID